MNEFSSLSAQLMNQLQGAPLQQFSRELGTDHAQTEQAVSEALPLLLGTLGKNASDPDGAQSLLGALGAHGGGLDGVLGSLLGGGGGAAQAQGGDILGHIFGDSQANAASGLGNATGIGGGNAANLLKMLAPIVMAFLAQHVQSRGMGADDLGQTLGQERDAAQQSGGIAGGLLGSMLDQDGDGQVGLGDLIKIGGSLLGGNRA